MVTTLLIILTLIAAGLLWFHLTNPYIKYTVFKSPYQTFLTPKGDIDYQQNYSVRIFSGTIANTLGYVKGGFLIVQNTFFSRKRTYGSTVKKITKDIHRLRFNPARPYLISGDQFSVLYPRNLGVFYNKLLNPNTALDKTDWQWRQQIYLQSVLFAIDGLSASPDPRTTVIPIGPKQAVLTQIHPGGTGSDQVFGLFYALNELRKVETSHDGKYMQQTRYAALRILKERAAELQFIYDSYIRVVYEPETSLVRQNLHLSGARDGVIRSSSFYDNIILFETICLAKKLGLKDDLGIDRKLMERKVKDAYWNDERGYYNDDVQNPHFSSDWLVGYVMGFFDLRNTQDRARTIRTIEYIESTDLVHPFPIKYQVEGNVQVPRIVKWFVPSYGKDVIWSYWGAQYIVLLAEVYQVTSNEMYLNKARQYTKQYRKNILRDAGFAETYDSGGEFLRATLYKSILITGWIVEFEYAEYLVARYSKQI